jgi:hypothetical protein
MYWEMYELLLQPSSHLDTDSLLSYAGLVGLDVARFRSDLASHAYAARIGRDVQEGIRNGVNATPKFWERRAHRRQVPLKAWWTLSHQVTAAWANLNTDPKPWMVDWRR